MRYFFIGACILMVVILIARKRIDFFSIAAIFLMIYNIHCVYGTVSIVSHEKKGTFYYSSDILPQVYCIVIGQMIFLAVYMLLNDRKERREQANHVVHEPFLADIYSEETTYRLFIYLCVIAWAIMLYNVFFKIGLSNISASKSEVWQKVGGLYTTANWMGMASFSYGIKNKKYLLALFGAAPVLLHFYIGSRAYMVVLILILVVNFSQAIGKSIIKHWKIVVPGAIAGIFILAYKKMYELIKMNEFAAAFKVLLDPETYAYVSRLGEPRIVLANLNYIIQNHVHLGIGDVWDRIISIIPFANDVFGSNYIAVSTLLKESMGSSYGLASNIWGEYYAIGSYALLIIMFWVWLKMLSWGNRCLQRNDYSVHFIIPPLLYTAFYVHRQDFVKIVGYYKTALLALLIFMVIGMVVNRQGMKIYCRARN